MNVVYTDTHRLHAPEGEFTRAGFVPYSESPDRVELILQTLQHQGFADIVPPREYPSESILAVHDRDYVHYLARVYAAWVEAGEPESGVVPVTFALRHQGQKPQNLVNQAGYYCFDTTPLVQGTWTAALAASRCALTGADLLLEGAPSAYALCRPPGHHAGRALYGGYCYLNNAAIAATHLNQHGRVAVLDLDYHHGNGTQDIFYNSDQVLFVSLHADPNRAYPFFWGYPDEQGAGAGQGYNRNFPLPAGVDDAPYLQVLDQALELIREFAPGFLVVSAGVDTSDGDPLGDFGLSLEAFARIGDRLTRMHLPTLLVQEGGYNTEQIGMAVVNLLRGFS